MLPAPNSLLSQITPLVLTFNEAPNIGRTLSRLAWAKRIVVVDSFSTDETLRIARSHPQVDVLQRSFDSHTEQWNFGVDQVRTDWVLSLDADYYLDSGFEQELAGLHPPANTVAHAASFRYCINGRPLRGTLYPPRLVMFRRTKCRYVQDGHTQLLKAVGHTAILRTPILHDDRKPLSHWLWSQDRYAQLEAQKLAHTPIRELGFNDRIRKTIVLGPPLVFIYTLFARSLILDGWPGWYYVFQRTLAETLLSLRLIEAKLGVAGREPGARSAESEVRSEGTRAEIPAQTKTSL